jgi:hypothetical protein
MADDVSVKFGASIGDVVEAVNGIKEQLDGLKEKVSGFAELAGISLSFDAFKEFVETMSELGEQTERTAEILGISTEQVGQLDFIAKQTGSSGEELSRTLEKLALNIAKAGERASPMTEALSAMGLSAKDLAGVPLPQMLDTLREHFQQLPQGMERAVVAQALVKGGAESLLPILSMSGEKYRDLIDTYDQTGAAMSGPMAAGFAETHEKIVTLETAVQGFGERLFSVLKPAIDGAIDWITSFIEALDAKHIAAALSSLVDTITSVILWIADVARQAYEVVDELSIRATFLAKHGLQAFNATNTAAMFRDIDAMRAGVDAKFSQMEADAKSFAGRVKAAISSGFGVGAETYGPPAPPPAPAGGANLFTDPAAIKEKTAALLAELQTKMKVDDLELDSEKQKLEAEGKLNQLSVDQKFQALQALLDKKYAIDRADLERELSIGGLSVQQHQAILDKLKELDARYQSDKLQLANQEAEAERALQQRQLSEAGRIASGITGVFNSQLTEILSGQETWSQGFAKMCGDMLVKFIEMVEQMIVEWAVLELITGGTAGGGSALGAFGQVAKGVLGFHADGAYNVPSTELAILHPGEMVLDSTSAGITRGMMENGGGFGGSPTIVVNSAPVIQAVDATGVTQLMQNHGETIARQVVALMNRHPSLRPAF